MDVINFECVLPPVNGAMDMRMKMDGQIYLEVMGIKWLIMK